MLFPKKTGALLLAAGAAWAYHKYTKMTPEEKQQLSSNLKEQGKRLMDMFVPKNSGNSSQPENNTVV